MPRAERAHDARREIGEPLARDRHRAALRRLARQQLLGEEAQRIAGPLLRQRRRQRRQFRRGRVQVPRDGGGLLQFERELRAVQPREHPGAGRGQRLVDGAHECRQRGAQIAAEPRPQRFVQRDGGDDFTLDAPQRRRVERHRVVEFDDDTRQRAVRIVAVGQ